MKILKYFSIKVAIFYLLFLNASALFSCDGKLLAEGEEGRVEEGWRYHQNFTLNITYQTGKETYQGNVDLTNEHHAMGFIINKLTPLTERKKCLLRFTPIILKEGKIKAGETLRLTAESFDIPDLTNNVNSHFSHPELVFLSGFEDQKKEHLEPHKTSFDFKLSTGETVAPNAFSMFSSFHLKSKSSVLTLPVAINIIQKNYNNFYYLDNRLAFRYPLPSATPKCFANGNYPRLYQSVLTTREKLKEKGELVANVAREVSKPLSYGDFDGVTRILDNGDAINALKSVSANPKMSDYACAEQAALNFLMDMRIINFLRASKLNKSKVIGIVVNAHCSSSPCCSCATSFARETEKGGIFNLLFDPKPIFLVISATNPFQRPTDKGMIPYDDTKFLGDLGSNASSRDEEVNRIKNDIKRPLELRIRQQGSDSNNVAKSEIIACPPYPTMLIEFDSNKQFVFQNYEYNRMIQAYVNKYVKLEKQKDLDKQKDKIEENKTEGEDVIGLGNTTP